MQRDTYTDSLTRARKVAEQINKRRKELMAQEFDESRKFADSHRPLEEKVVRNANMSRQRRSMKPAYNKHKNNISQNYRQKQGSSEIIGKRGRAKSSKDRAIELLDRGLLIEARRTLRTEVYKLNPVSGPRANEYSSHMSTGKIARWIDVQAGEYVEAELTDYESLYEELLEIKKKNGSKALSTERVVILRPASPEWFDE